MSSLTLQHFGQGLIFPSSSILLFHLVTWPVWSSKNAKEIQLGQCFSFCWETGAKPFSPTFYSNLIPYKHKIEDILIMSSLRVLNAFILSCGSEERFFTGKISSVSSSFESQLYHHIIPSTGQHLLMFFTWLLTPLLL
jgi:hypothetical protein